MERENDRQHELAENLLADQAPAMLGRLSEDEVEIAQTVAFLKAARPDALEPDSAFVEDLRKRLFESATSTSTGGPAPRKAQPAAQAPDIIPGPARPLSRRRLLGALASTAAAGLAMGAAIDHVAAADESQTRERAMQEQLHAAEQQSTALRQEQSGPYSVPLVGQMGEWVTVANDEELAPGDARRFEAGALIGYLLRDTTGGYTAVSASCTHMGCLLTWQASGRRLLCPCHGSAYDEAGQVISGIARHPLPHINVRVTKGGQVQVWTVTPRATNSGVAPYSTW